MTPSAWIGLAYSVVAVALLWYFRSLRRRLRQVEGDVAMQASPPAAESSQVQ